ncbi:MAG: hypothetical protein KBF68_11450, partial [Nitrosomonas sp.]|nr:hypothetical protein [Nitrosomonas sp.]
SGVSYDCNQDLQSSFGVTWRIYEVVRKIYYLKLQDLFSVSLAYCQAHAQHAITPRIRAITLHQCLWISVLPMNHAAHRICRCTP